MNERNEDNRLDRAAERLERSREDLSDAIEEQEGVIGEEDPEKSVSGEETTSKSGRTRRDWLKGAGAVGTLALGGALIGGYVGAASSDGHREVLDEYDHEFEGRETVMDITNEYRVFEDEDIQGIGESIYQEAAENPQKEYSLGFEDRSRIDFISGATLEQSHTVDRETYDHALTTARQVEGEENY